MYDFELLRNRSGIESLPGIVMPHPGDRVRLRFRDRRTADPHAQRAGRSAWVRVVHCVPGPSFVGHLDDPAASSLLGLHGNAPILFESEHVFDVAPNGRTRADETSLLCLGSRLLSEQFCFAMKALRTLPTHDRDSGWRFLSEHDEEDDIHRPSRVAVFRVGWLVHLDPSLRALLGAPAGSRFEREHPGEVWCSTGEEVVPLPLAGS